MRCVGRRKHGPRQLKKGGPFFAVLHVQHKDREVVGKERLLKSLQTTDHTEALKRYATVLSQLERDLEALLKPETLRDRVEAWRDPEQPPGETPFSPLELTRLALGGFNPDNPTHVQVFDSFNMVQPLPPTWDEALELWVKEAKRNGVAPTSIPKYKTVVTNFSHIGLPHQITKQMVDDWIDQMEEEFEPNTIKTKKGYLSAVFEILIAKDKLNTLNPFKAVKYNPKIPLSAQRRPFTDSEVRLIHQKHPLVFQMIMTGLRSGEFFSRYTKDLQDGFLTVDDQPTRDNWKPKTRSSYRRLPVPPGFYLIEHKAKVASKTTTLVRELRKDITDKTATVHSARHTFYSLSRRADCNDSVIEAISGHAKKEGSRVAQSYGLFDDQVLLREAQKVWDFVNTDILN